MCTFPKSKTLQQARALHNPPQHSKSFTIKEHSLNCISVPNFASLPQSFPKVKVPMHVHYAYCTCYARALRTSSSNAMHHRITHIELHQCSKFGIASSKFPRSKGPLSNKVFRFWRVRPAPHKNGNQKSTHIGVVYV